MRSSLLKIYINDLEIEVDMPIRKDSKDNWWWGNRGPFDTKKKAQEVARAAHASGYSKSEEMAMNENMNEFHKVKKSQWATSHRDERGQVQLPGDENETRIIEDDIVNDRGDHTDAAQKGWSRDHAQKYALGADQQNSYDGTGRQEGTPNSVVNEGDPAGYNQNRVGYSPEGAEDSNFYLWLSEKGRLEKSEGNVSDDQTKTAAAYNYTNAGLPSSQGTDMQHNPKVETEKAERGEFEAQTSDVLTNAGLERDALEQKIMEFTEDKENEGPTTGTFRMSANS